MRRAVAIDCVDWRPTMLNGYLTRRPAVTLLAAMSALLAVALLIFAPPPR